MSVTEAMRAVNQDILSASTVAVAADKDAYDKENASRAATATLADSDKRVDDTTAEREICRANMSKAKALYDTAKAAADEAKAAADEAKALYDTAKAEADEANVNASCAADDFNDDNRAATNAADEAKAAKNVAEVANAALRAIMTVALAGPILVVLLPASRTFICQYTKAPAKAPAKASAVSVNLD